MRNRPKVVLVSIDSRFIHTNIALRYIKAFTKDLEYDCLMMEYTIQSPLMDMLDDILDCEPDMVGFSTYIWNVEQVSRISRLIRLARPSIRLLFGGPEVSWNAEESLMGLKGDYIIAGEGEETYRELIEKCLDNMETSGSFSLGDNDEVRGLATIRNGIPMVYPPRDKMDLARLPFPYSMDEDLSDRIACIEASRGCPYSCSYCLSSAEKDLRFRSVASVMDDVESLLKLGAKLVKFMDRTFNAHPDAAEVFRRIISLDTSAVFHFEMSPSMVNDAQMEVLKEAPPGRIQFETGVQSTDENVLHLIRRHSKGFREGLLSLLTLGNIHHHLDLIAGLPMDTMESFRRSFNEVYSLGPDVLQLGFLKIIRGTPMESEVKRWGMVHSPFPPYQVISTATMGRADVGRLKAAEKALDKYHNSGKFVNSLTYAASFHEDPLVFFEGLGNALDSEGYRVRSPSSDDYYRIFLMYSARVLEMKAGFEPGLMRDLVKYDFLLWNRRQGIPFFLERIDKDTNDIRRKLKREEGVVGHVEWFENDVVSHISGNERNPGPVAVLFDKSRTHGKIITL
ncbi:B12-binding domain-containing radical SAM protein [Youngiibacter fragilis]|uniref:Radical SAM protein n=1 Tax=Youngiibacter fragilis 232.1 TaxID=994573 RepID=V7I0R7_9CLOT|nr:B12-binding domain-containing radical SAM protein [Youngiibacter fragilis]ETA79835.1 radical SAM protein [Youngiibacter fragilis 232.1]